MKRTTTGKNSFCWLEGTICEEEIKNDTVGIAEYFGRTDQNCYG